MLLTSQPPSLDTRDSACPGLVIWFPTAASPAPTQPRHCGRALGLGSALGPESEGGPSFLGLS